MEPEPTHYNIQYGVSYNTEAEAYAAIAELVKEKPERWQVRECRCDQLTRVERLVMFSPRLFGWLEKR